MIEYSDSYSIKRTYEYADEKWNSFSDFESFRDFLEESTTDPEKCRNLISVNVRMPSDQLNRGFRIIDTPGTNATELWHEAVTRRAISEMSDVSIVLIDANKALPESFCAFVSDTLEDILPQCVFVVTKIDLVREREREQILSYVKMKLENTFGLKDPPVLPYASLDVLENSGSELAKQSMESEQKLMEYTGKYKALSQTKKIILLIRELYDSLSDNFNKLDGSYVQELEMLERSRTADLSEFISYQKNIRIKDFNNSFNEYNKGKDELHKHLKDKENDIISSINCESDASSVYNYLNNFENKANEIENEASEFIVPYQNMIMEKYKRQLNIFESELGVQFKKLNVIKVAIENNSIEKTAPIHFNVNDSTYKNVLSYTLNKSFTFVLHLIIGLVLMLMGGILTDVMGNISILISFFGLFYPLIATLISNKKHVKESVNRVSPIIKRYFSLLEDDILKQMEEYQKKMSDSLEKQIEDFLPKYKRKINIMMNEENEKSKVIQEKQKKLRADMNELENRRFKLDSIRKQLDNLNRKE